MTEAGLLEQVLGGVPLLASARNMIKLEAALALAPDPVRRLGALAVSIVEDAERLRERLRLDQCRARAACCRWRTLVADLGRLGRAGSARAALSARARALHRPRAAGLERARPKAPRMRAGTRSPPCRHAGSRRRFRSRPPTSSRAACREGRASAPRWRAAEEAWIAEGFPLDPAALAQIADAVVAGPT